MCGDFIVHIKFLAFLWSLEVNILHYWRELFIRRVDYGKLIFKAIIKTGIRNMWWIQNECSEQRKHINVLWQGGTERWKWWKMRTKGRPSEPYWRLRSYEYPKSKEKPLKSYRQEQDRIRFKILKDHSSCSGKNTLQGAQVDLGRTV